MLFLYVKLLPLLLVVFAKLPAKLIMRMLAVSNTPAQITTTFIEPVTDTSFQRFGANTQLARSSLLIRSSPRNRDRHFRSRVLHIQSSFTDYFIVGMALPGNSLTDLNSEISCPTPNPQGWGGI
ncbi:hypothetical protein VTL71DRAFT_13048 [Oculimacula yallundae]|uniref:Secreted protein n=1 Tax=Oculimacula yallundae TaxID=86028 RepID=A0ABR4CR11_9HELO